VRCEAAHICASRFELIKMVQTFPAATAAMPSLQQLHTAADVNKLPIEDVEDMSLVYSTVTKR
jgi:hypothetical protein